MRQRRAWALVLLVLFSAVLFAACGSSQASFDKVEVGMTADQVRGLMGEPESKSGVMGVEQWVYQGKYAVQFLGGKVVSKAKQ